MKRLLFLIFLLFLAGKNFSQNVRKIDSLFKVLSHAPEDSTKADILFRLGWETSYRNLGEGLKYSKEAMDLSEKLDYKKGLVRSYHDLGSIYLDMGEYDRANEYLFKELRLGEKMGNKKIHLGACYVELGILFGNQKNYPRSLYFDSLALEDFKKNGDTSAIAVVYNNIASVYSDRGQYRKALEIQKAALAINIQLRDEDAIASSYNNIGDLYGHLGEKENALKNLDRARAIYKTQNSVYSLSHGMLSYAEFYRQDKDYKTALSYLDSALKMSKETGQKEEEMAVYSMFAECYEQRNDLSNAYRYFKNYAELKDSLFTAEKEKEITKNEMKYEFDKLQEKQKIEQEKKDALAGEQIKHQRLIIYSSVAGLLAAAIFVFFIYRGYRQKQKINSQLAEKNFIIEEKNKNITDSINYARHIQNAILPPEKAIKNVLPSSFILFRPKDIVSGDLYWIETPGSQLVLFAAVDCTGHGVPGAMVSVVGHNSLNRCLKEFGLSKPAEILNRLNELIEETFEKSEDNINDGMDIALCSLDMKTLQLEFAGANNPLWIIKKGAKEITEIKGDKQPIGKFTERKPFTHHSVQLSKGDRIYIFTDGYADQFGGNRGKKFKYRPFQELLLTSAHLPLQEQKKLLNETITQWMGQHEQVDDILVMGVEV